jgi:hypothetical protein
LGFAAQAYVERNAPSSPPVVPLLAPELGALPTVALPVAQKVLQQLDASTHEYGWHVATVRAFEGKFDEYHSIRRNMTDKMCPKMPVGQINQGSASKFVIQRPPNTASGQNK